MDVIGFCIRAAVYAVFGMVGIPTAFGQASGPPAVAYQIDPAHTGTTRFTPAFYPRLEEQWRVDLGGSVSYPLIANGSVFVTFANSEEYGTNLVALDETTGQVLWGPIAVPGTYTWANAAYEGGRVFVVNFDGLMKAFDASTGILDWSVQLPGQYAFTSAPTATYGIVYVGGAGTGGTAYAVDQSNGEVLWTQAMSYGGSSSPAVAGDAVFVSYACSQVYGFDAQFGSPLWNYSGQCEGGGAGTPVANNSRLYVRDFVSTPPGYIFDTASGDLLGRFDAQTTPAIGAQTGYFLQSGTLRGIELDDNTVLWSFAGDGQLSSAPLLIDDFVLVGSGSGNLYVLNSSTGHEVWSTQVGAPILPPGEGNALLLIGLAAGDGIVAVPASNSLVVYRPLADTILLDGFDGP